VLPNHQHHHVPVKYGRTEEEWDHLEDVGWKFLKERARLPNTTSYTEMNAVLVRRAGLSPAFDFNQQADRAAMSYLLRRIGDRSFAASGLLITALVQFLNENDAGQGFFDLAYSKKLIPRPRLPELERLTFWSQHVGQVQGYDWHATP
jgi:hypothetical protein